MKIRNHRKYEWWFVPDENSKIERRLYTFKYKSDLMKFLNKNFENSLNGTVSLDHKCFNSSGVVREWFVWYNDYAERKEPLKIVLKQLNFRGGKYIFKPSKISKENKKYFAFSNKIISLMSRIEDENGQITEKDAEKLINLFYKRGFKDFIPDVETQEYIDYYVKEGIPFSYWSDRCNFVRCKAILEYFKSQGLILN